MLADHTDMGHDVNAAPTNPTILPDVLSEALNIRSINWLDTETAQYVRHVLTLLITQREDLRAAILFGSVARQQARPLADVHPSDVDVVLIFDTEHGRTTISGSQYSAVSATKVAVIDQYPNARDLQFALTLPTFAGWDTSFVENIARDGVLLWAREPLPPQLQAVQARADADAPIK